MNEVYLENAEVTVKAKHNGKNITLSGHVQGYVETVDEPEDFIDRGHYALRPKIGYNLRLVPSENGTYFSIKHSTPVERTARIDIPDCTAREIEAARLITGAPEHAQIRFDRMRQIELAEPQPGVERPVTIIFYWSE